MSILRVGPTLRQARVDGATVRYSREVEWYARALREDDERLRCEEAENPAEGYEATLPDPEGNLTTLYVTAHQERLERAERELARVRRELAASPGETDTVMAEVAG